VCAKNKKNVAIAVHSKVKKNRVWKLPHAWPISVIHRVSGLLVVCCFKKNKQKTTKKTKVARKSVLPRMAFLWGRMCFPKKHGLSCVSRKPNVFFAESKNQGGRICSARLNCGSIYPAHAHTHTHTHIKHPHHTDVLSNKMFTRKRNNCKKGIFRGGR